MPQFTNPYNSQTGMGNMGQQNNPGYQNSWMPDPMGGQTNAQGNQMMNQNISQPIRQPNTQGWKSYSAPTIKPTEGRWVDSFEEIMPQEVQMNGQMYLFPQNDWSCIYARYWDNNGQLLTFRFLPEKVEQPVQQSSPDMDSIIKSYEQLGTTMMDRLDSFNGKLDDICSRLGQPGSSRNRKTNKEEDAV